MPAAYIARSATSILGVQQGCLWLQDLGSGESIELSFEGANPEAPIQGVEETGALASFFRGADPAGWHAAVPLCAGVVYENLYPGIDLKVYTRNGEFEYDVIVEPHATLDAFIVRYDGVKAACIDADGALVLEAGVQTVRQVPPTTWQISASGEQIPLSASFCLLSGNRYKLLVEGRDFSLPLIIDPGLVWSTFFGGKEFDAVNHAVVMPDGRLIVAGYTNSSNFPIMPGAYDSMVDLIRSVGFQADVFISQFDVSGQLLHSTYLGGHSTDTPFGLDVLPDGRITVGGGTASPDFPTTPGAYDTTPTFGLQGFVTQFDSTGSQLLFSTVLGGTKQTVVEDMAVDNAGCIILAGYTQDADFPITAGAFDAVYGEPLTQEGFVTKFTPACDALVFSTYLGESNQDYIEAVAVDGTGAVTVAGMTVNTDFPVTPGAFDTQPNPYGLNAQFVTRFDPAGSSLLFSTFFGGDEIGPEKITDIAVDASGATTLTGYTDKADFPVTAGVHDPFLYDAYDAFVSRLDPSGSSLIFSTLYGVGSSDDAYALVLDSAGCPTIFGQTWSENLPTTPGTFQAEKVGPWPDAFLARFSPDASELLYATYLGGSDKDWGEAQDPDNDGGLALTPDGEIYALGITLSRDFPTTPHGFDTGFNGGADGFITRFDLLPAGARKYGAASPSCQGLISIGLLMKPHVQALLFTSTNAPPLAQGFVVVGAAAAVPSIPVLGASLHVSPYQPFALIPLQSNEVGFGSLQLSAPSISAGTHSFAQTLWLGTPSCGGAGTLAASSGLVIEFP